MLFRQALIAIILSAGTSDASISPPRVSFPELLEHVDREEPTPAPHVGLWKALKEYGFCSLTDVFHREDKNAILQKLQACMESSDDKANLHVFEDGTHRKTYATHAAFEAPSSRIHPAIQVGTSAACQDFEVSSQGFRQRVDSVSHAVALQLDADNFKTHDDDYSSMKDIVFRGEHLEHFHSYDKFASNDSPAQSTTMDWHQDQGLFLLFTPGQRIAEGAAHSQDFYVKVDGQEHLVNFSEHDDLIILLGDGVKQLGMDLEAPWHSVSVQDNTKGRVWYGRMVLPPADLLHPPSGLSYGELRSRLNENKAGDIGCSSLSTTARHLQVTECTVEGELLCWHQCMVTADFGVSETLCADQGLSLECVDPQNILWDGSHADKEAGYAPKCFDKSGVVEPATGVSDPQGDVDDGAANVHSDNGDSMHSDGDDGDHMRSTALSAHQIFRMLALTSCVGLAWMHLM